jgi:hypothetical protein
MKQKEISKAKVIIWAIIAILILCTIDFYLYVHYVYEPRQENYVWFDDGVYFDCTKTADKIICSLPDNKTIEIKRSYDIKLK